MREVSRTADESILAHGTQLTFDIMFLFMIDYWT